MTGYNLQQIQSGSEYIFKTDTPLLFQWLPRNYGSSIPECYLSRLSTWAKTENQRLIKLVINGSGFSPEQYKELEGKISNKEFNPHGNIEVIDFNKLDFNKLDLIPSKSMFCNIDFSKLDFISPSTSMFNNNVICHKYVSEYYSRLYSFTPKERFTFGVEIDAMRIFTLIMLELPLIYFDFDILPKENQKIGEVKAEQGILLIETDSKSDNCKNIRDLENSIIAVSDPGRIKLIEICHEVKGQFMKKHNSTFMAQPDYIYHIMSNIIRETELNDYYERELRKILNKEERSKLNTLFHKKTFGFQSNGGNVVVKYDHSWHDNSELQSTHIKDESSASKDEIDELTENLSPNIDADRLNTSSNITSIGDVTCIIEESAM
ncbi:hypothetical protein [Orientia tsutsugamushi]|uniref:hypothetical protein n=1 Tax=Orientia tsutsugamushi TaxID=784 RepID=UPI000D5A687C|nr:Uncharacterised protein [Orientia tsutsugamushi]